MHTQSLRTIKVGFLAVSVLSACSSGGAGGSGSGGAASSEVIPSSSNVLAGDSLIVGLDSSAVSQRPFSFLPYAYAGGQQRVLLSMRANQLKRVLFYGGSSSAPAVDTLRAVGPDYNLVQFSSGNVGLLQNADGVIYNLTPYLDAGNLYVLVRDGYLYLGKPSAYQITEIKLSNLTVRRVNDPSVNKVRLQGPNGDFWVSRDTANGKRIVGAYVTDGSCATQNWCLFFEDNSAAALGAVSWPGRSILYTDDGNIYGWDVTSTQTGANWTNVGKLLKFEYSQTPFAGGALGRVTSTTINSMSGSGHPFPFELPARKNDWYDNGPKYFFIPQGYYKVTAVVNGGATMTWNPVDLSVLYQQFPNNGHGPIDNLTWTDPVTGSTRSVSAIVLYNGYLYFKKQNQVSRISLSTGAVTVLYTDSTIYNFDLIGNYLYVMTATATLQIDLNNLGATPVTILQDLGLI